jgi:hypothetical protein
MPQFAVITFYAHEWQSASEHRNENRIVRLDISDTASYRAIDNSTHRPSVLRGPIRFFLSIWSRLFACNIDNECIAIPFDDHRGRMAIFPFRSFEIFVAALLATASQHGTGTQSQRDCSQNGFLFMFSYKS